MIAPDRIGNWYIGGGLGGFDEEGNAEDHFGAALPGGKIDAGGDFLFATVRGYF